jgi:diaminohydroxyphosphoribosylaminopyrimidine deaminase / 5-amino-6-(5-phosphoribosylamino)uracil reductase
VTPSANTDEFFLQRALELARLGIGLTSPNPCVGAVIVDQNGAIVGEGFHTYQGMKHAEILALARAGTKASGSTLYVNLEPCSHQGRTGPCADAIIAAGIRRVVACMQDPNPQVAGQGFARLRDAGIEVLTGLLEADAKELNESFARYIRHHIPLVTLKAAMTLDGKIAPPPGSAPEPGGASRREWITGETARAHVQELRHRNDAILAGIGTILADDPLLTDRSGKPRRRPLLRVVLDSHLRLPLQSSIAQTAHDDVLVFYSSAEEERKQLLRDRGIRVEPISMSADGRLDIKAVLRRLGELEIISLLTEGGSQVNAAALSTGIVDKVFLYYAPKILGPDSVPFATGAGFPPMQQIKSVRLHRFEEDFAVEGYLRDVYD